MKAKFLDSIGDFRSIKRGRGFIASNSNGREFEAVFRTRYKSGKLIFLGTEELPGEILEYSVEEERGTVKEGKFHFEGSHPEDKLSYCGEGVLVRRIKPTPKKKGVHSYYKQCLELIGDTN